MLQINLKKSDEKERKFVNIDKNETKNYRIMGKYIFGESDNEDAFPVLDLFFY